MSADPRDAQSVDTATRIQLQGMVRTELPRTSQTVGVVIQDFGIGNGFVESNPRMVLEKDANTLIVYPRLKTWRSVDDTVDLSPKVVKDVWKAKQLGLLGKSPETNCPSTCPHYKFGIDLPEDDIETAKPLPLIFAKGMDELGVDLDYEYLQSHLWSVAPSLSEALFEVRYRGDKVPKAQREKLRSFLQEKFDLDEFTAKKLVPEKGQTRPHRYPSDRQILKEEASEIEPWEELLPKKILKDVSQTAQSRASRLYKLPKDSSQVIRKAWKKW